MSESVTDRLFHESAAEDSLNAAERLSDAAWARLKESPEKFRVLTGERPTGPLHLGHYFGSLQRRVEVQSYGVQTWLLLADYQALTDRTGSAALQDSMADIVLDYLAVGLDIQSDRGLVFRHSQVPELNQLMLPFLSLVSVAEIDRNPTVKSEIETLGEGGVTGLMFNYPVHQAADILFCHGNLVPGGRDQLPHVEITRKIARRFNNTYSKKKRYFEEPTLLFGEAPMLLGTDGRKMGKSARNAVFIRDDESTTAAVLKKAVTDSDPSITYDPVARPNVANLLLLAALAAGTTPEAVADEIGPGGSARLKAYVTEAVNEHFRPIRARRAEYAADPEVVGKVLERGNEIARQAAKKTMAEVHALMHL
ncbi:MAG TPA: tryptophan--tRNA ligase [Mycobacteriales bacterium]